MIKEKNADTDIRYRKQLDHNDARTSLKKFNEKGWVTDGIFYRGVA